MDFSWSTQQDSLYAAAAEFASSRVNPAIAGRKASTFTRGEWELIAEAGLVGLSLPLETGGGAHDAITTARVIEGFAEQCDDVGLVFGALAHLFACAMPIAHAGDDELRRRYLPGLADGSLIGANAITEVEAGSDVFALRTTAERSGGGYALNGMKNFVTNGPIADIFLVYASTRPAHRHLGISAFVVRRDLPGVTIGENFEKIGLSSTPVSTVAFRDCFIDESDRVGTEGQGARIFTSSMSWERTCLFAMYIGMMERQLREVIDHVRHRRQFGSPLATFQAVSHKAADMRIRLDAAKLLLYRACWTLDQGIDATREVAEAKIAVSEAAVQSSLDAVQLLGGSGIVAGGVERMLRDAIPGTIFSGTSEVHRNVIARSLGL